MPKDPGYTRYECDRSAKHGGFAKEGSPSAAQFREIRRTRSDGTTQNFILCDECYSKYKELADDHDRQFNSFMAGDK